MTVTAAAALALSLLTVLEKWPEFPSLEVHKIGLKSNKDIK
jgi:hypothetical protein